RGAYSASLGYLKGNRLKVFTTSDPILRPKKGGYQPFALYALLDHHGDFTAATAMLAELGYGRNGQPSDEDRTADVGDEPPIEEQPDADIPIHLTDRGNALRLVKRHGQDLHYIYRWKKWLVWDGTRWKVDEGNLVEALAKQVIVELYAA